MTPLAGEFAIATWQKGTFLTAVGGGGRISDTIRTDATKIQAWEKFKLWGGDPSNPQYSAIQTVTGNFLTAVDGGGRISDTIHTNATQINTWEMFRLIPSGVSQQPGMWWSAIATYNGHYVTAVGGGGQSSGDTLHTDALKPDNWELFILRKCGDLGSGISYHVLDATGGLIDVVDGGGRAGNAIDETLHPDKSWNVLTLLRQSDGTYALRTANGINYVTAVGGGGLIQNPATPNIFATDRTQVQAWEKFRIWDLGDCVYVIQTVSGGFLNGVTSTAQKDINAAGRWILMPAYW
jgi:hypothetical protein